MMVLSEEQRQLAEEMMMLEDGEDYTDMVMMLSKNKTQPLSSQLLKETNKIIAKQNNFM